MITEDKVNFLFAPFGSGATKAASAVSEKYGIPMIAPTASSAEVYDQNYKFLFGTLTPNETVSEPIAKLVTEKNRSIKRVAILARNDLFPLAVAQAFEKAAKAQNLEVVTFERYAIGTMDHSAAITQMRAARPDWVYASGYINDLILIRKQMNDLGLKPQVIDHDRRPRLPGIRQDRRSAGREHLEHVVVASGGALQGQGRVRLDRSIQCGLGEEVRRRGRLRGGLVRGRRRDPAARHRGRRFDRSRRRFAMRSRRLNVETFYGKVKFGPTGQINSLEPPVFQLQGGKPVVLWPSVIKQGELKFSRTDLRRARRGRDRTGRSAVVRRTSAPSGLRAARVMIYLQIAANGLVLGGLYACIAVGFSLVWGVLNVINILHGTFIVLGILYRLLRLRLRRHSSVCLDRDRRRACCTRSATPFRPASSTA